MKLTKDTIAALTMPEGKTDHCVWDDDLQGFGVRLRTGGAKTFVIQYRVDGQQRRPKIGDVGKVDVKDARKMAKARLAEAQLGTDIIADKAKVKTAAKIAQETTFEKVARDYLKAKTGIWKPRSIRDGERDLLVRCPSLMQMPLNNIKRKDISDALDAVVIRSGSNPASPKLSDPALKGRKSAEHTRAFLSGMFVWAIGKGKCDANPVNGTINPAEGMGSRKRVLDDEELAAVWRACREDAYGWIVRLLILTGCRRTEIAALKWSELDMEKCTLKIDGEAMRAPDVIGTKTSVTHKLTLPPMAMDILRKASRDGEYVFANRKGGPFSSWIHHGHRLTAQIVKNEGKKLDDWVLHDLRRTMKTGLSALGIPPHVTERILNHAKGAMEKVYDQYNYEPEIKLGLAKWADHIAAITENRRPPLRIVA